ASPCLGTGGKAHTIRTTDPPWIEEAGPEGWSGGWRPHQPSRGQGDPWALKSHRLENQTTHESGFFPLVYSTSALRERERSASHPRAINRLSAPKGESGPNPPGGP